jgi:hypothetical protein
MATALFVSQSAGASPDLLYPRDPIFLLSIRTLSWVLGGACLGVGLICLLAEPHGLPVVLVAWLATSFELYQVSLLWTGSPNLHGYLGESSTAFGLSPGQLNVAANLVWGYLFCGSHGLLFWLWWRHRRQVRPAVLQPSTNTI